MFKRISIIFFIAAFSLTGCSPAPKEASFSLDHDHFTVSSWQRDGSQIETVKGKLSLDQKPIEHASIQIGEKKKISTDQHGEFSFTVDKTAISERRITISSLDGAKIGGKVLTENQKKIIQTQTTIVSVDFPIKILKEQPDSNNPNQVVIDAQIQLEKGMKFQFPSFNSYTMHGIIKDAKGNPVKGAVVSTVRSTNRDVGEGFNQSKPSKEDGSYAMMYIPENDEETQLRINTGDIMYKLPANKFFHFPDGTSSEVDLILPEKGDIIDDKPPALVAKTYLGANYQGVLVGVQTDASVTIPDEAGNFKIKLKKEDWVNSPRFFETIWSGFSASELKPGDFAPANLKQSLKNEEPQNIRVSN
jgi:hypothetical protein